MLVPLKKKRNKFSFEIRINEPSYRIAGALFYSRKKYRSVVIDIGGREVTVALISTKHQWMTDTIVYTFRTTPLLDIIMQEDFVIYPLIEYVGGMYAATKYIVSDRDGNPISIPAIEDAEYMIEVLKVFNK